MTEKTEPKAHQGIVEALIAAQTSMGKAVKNSVNPAFKSKYADLASVIDACLEALNANGIALLQPLGEDEHGRYCETILMHTGGETLQCRVPLIVAKNDMQGYGSAVTYARRYGLMAMTGIAPEDDDGNAAVAAKPAPPMSKGLQDAWNDAVFDSLPPHATARQKAEAFARAICEGFAGKSGRVALDNEWERRLVFIERLRDSHPDLFDEVTKAYDAKIETL